MVYHYFTGLSPNSSKIYCKILQARYYFLTLFKLPSGSTLLGALGALGYLWIGFLYPQHNSARKNGAGTFISFYEWGWQGPEHLQDWLLSMTVPGEGLWGLLLSQTSLGALCCHWTGGDRWSNALSPSIFSATYVMFFWVTVMSSCCRKQPGNRL